jgi:hypothetical protein
MVFPQEAPNQDLFETIFKYSTTPQSSILLGTMEAILHHQILNCVLYLSLNALVEPFYSESNELYV